MTYGRGLHPTHGRRAFPHDGYAGDPSRWNGTYPLTWATVSRSVATPDED